MQLQNIALFVSTLLFSESDIRFIVFHDVTVPTKKTRCIFDLVFDSIYSILWLMGNITGILIEIKWSE